MRAEIVYDRRVSEEFLAHFLKGGVAHSLARMAVEALYPLDLQMRRQPRSGAEHASLYTGLTDVLKVEDTKKGLRLSTHKTRATSANRWHEGWTKAADESQWRQAWGDVDNYLERVIPKATKSHGLTEGAVQAALSSSRNESMVTLDREVVPSFRDAAFRAEVREQCMRPLVEALKVKDFAAGKVPDKFGMECDLLAVDTNGRLLAVEVKPVGAGTITWVPAQAAMYARTLQRWVDVDAEARDVVVGMLDQRRKLRGEKDFVSRLPQKLTVTPVVALQRGASDLEKERMLSVRDHLVSRDLGVPPVEILEVSITGGVSKLGE